MKCPHCHAAIPDKFSFCPQCGAAVRTESGRVIRPDGARRVVNTVLIGVLAANVVGGAFLIHVIHKKHQSPPETSIAEVQPEDSEPEKTTEAPKETKPETEAAAEATTKATTIKETEATTAKTTKATTTTEKTTKTTKATTTTEKTTKTTKATTTTEKTTKKTTEKTTAKTTAKSAKKTKTTASSAKKEDTKTTAKQEQQQQQQQQVVQQPAQQEQQSTLTSDYYAKLGAMPFVCGNNGDPFLPPGMYTKAANEDGSAQSEADAKQAMLNLPINWGNDADIFCGTTPDDNGTSNSTYRYIADAFPVPGFADLQMPASIDLYIHNGTAAHGSHLRAIDYRFGNHPDYSGPYIWTRAEIESYFKQLTEYADSLYGGHEQISDSTLGHYRYRNGALDIGYYERNGRYILWISRSND